MSIKSDKWIKRMAQEHQMITPFEPEQVKVGENGNRLISYGTSSYGYDIRLAEDGFRIFSSVGATEIDPKKFDERILVETPLLTAEDGSKYYMLPAHHYALGMTVETFKMPSDAVGIVYCKSTLARAAFSLNITALEPSWEGRLVVEMGNMTNLPIRVYVAEGIGQIHFYQSDEQCDVTYATRKDKNGNLTPGKYMHQKQLTLAKV